MTQSLDLKDLFVYPMARYIPPVAKVSDTDARTVATELHEYVVTAPIERALLTFLEVYGEARTRPTDRIGVWISGFFGSGKSHFAKVLSYLLEDRVIEGQPAREIFSARLGESARRAEIEAGLHRAGMLDSHVIMFNIKTEEDQQAKGEASDTISQIMYRRYLASRGLSTNPQVASLELSLMDRGLYDAFKAEVARREGHPWEEEREDFLFIRATATEALQAVAPEAYPTREEAQAALALLNQTQRLTVSDLVKRLMAYVETLARAGHPERPPRLVFIIDEMGQFIGTDEQKLLELQSIAEAFSVKGRGKLWLIVTAQAQLEQLIQGVAGVSASFGKIGDRFDMGLTLTSDDVERVLHGRILQKKSERVPDIHAFYHQHAGALTVLGTLPGSSRREWPGMTAEHFTAATPFLPYHPTLIQAIFANLQKATATGFQITDEARSMIGMAQGVLSARANGFLDGELGRTVALDMVYDRIAVDLRHRDRREITNLPKQLPAYHPLDQRVLKALYLLQAVPWLAVTSETLAHALMRDIRTEDVGTLRAEVEASLQRLLDARYVIPKEDNGPPEARVWEFLTGTKKSFEEEVAGVRVPEAELRRQARAALTEVLRPVGQLNYKNGMRTFDVTVRGDGEVIQHGERLTLEVYSPLHVQRAQVTVDDLEQIVSFGTPETVYWVAAARPTLEEQLKRAHRLEVTLKKWRAKATKTDEEREIIREKETELHTLSGKIASQVSGALLNGTLVWHGRAEALDGRTSTLNPIFNRKLAEVVPTVYPKFALAEVKPNEGDINAVLTVAPYALSNIGAALDLFDAEGHLNQHSAVVAEVREELERRRRRGQDSDGKTLEEHFTGGVYGWHPLNVRLIRAAMFRAGMVTARADNVIYRDPNVPAAQQIFTHTRPFRRAVLTYEPAEVVLPAELRRAQDELKVIFDTPQREETANVLAAQITEALEAWRERARRVMYQLQPAGYPIPTILTQTDELYRQVTNFRNNPGKVVKAFLAHLETVRAWHAEAQALYQFVVQQRRLPEYQRARRLLKEIAGGAGVPGTEPLLQAEDAKRWRARLQELMDTGQVPHAWDAFREAYTRLHERYQEVYAALHAAYLAAVQEGREALEAADVPLQQYTSSHKCTGLTWDDEGIQCQHCQGTLEVLYLRTQTIPREVQVIREQYESSTRYQDGDRHKPRLKRLRVADVVPQRRITGAEELDAALDALRQAVSDALGDADAVEIT